MIRKYLSFNFKNPFFKWLMLFISFIINLGVFIFSIAYILWGAELKIVTVTITQLYFFLSIVFDYFLIKSKDVLYDETKLFIRIGRGNLKELPFSQVENIKRVFFYFYQITFKDIISDKENKIYYYVSPYPTLTRQKELIEISGYVQKVSKI